ncbi:MAG: phosphatase [Geobacteraceae bacterium]|nr:phosphatase [Geobacteraceae bacterium]
MKIIADLHVHTVASGHAYSTINEIASAARRKGLKAVAITDHGPALPGGPHLYHFGAMRFIPPEICGVRILRGAEANIIGSDGSLDLPESYLARLDFVLAGFHEGCGFDNRGISENTGAVLRAMENKHVRAVAHSGNPAFPVSYSDLVRGASASGTALEINNSSLSMSRKGSRPNCETLAELIAGSDALVAIGSDAHIAQGVGVFEEALAMILKAGIREEQVINASFDRLTHFLDLDRPAAD